jgi:hypothetical protein
MAAQTGQPCSKLELTVQCAKCVRAERACPRRRTSILAADAQRDARCPTPRLADADLTSKSDPACLLYMRRSPIANWELVGKTGAPTDRRRAHALAQTLPQCCVSYARQLPYAVSP